MGFLTLSLEENLMHLGSSLIIFFTSFHVDVKVIFQKRQIETLQAYLQGHSAILTNIQYQTEQVNAMQRHNYL